jgi:SAM-dependent methyltransferase
MGNEIKGYSGICRKLYIGGVYMNNEQEIYSKQWNDSSNYFYNNNSYSWMCNQIKKYRTILEIGCGTGQSTLSLIENGHKVIAVEKNNYCIEEAKSLLKNKGYIVGSSESDLQACDVVFLRNDLFDNQIINYLNDNTFDLVICWNVGSYWSKEMIKYYLPHMLKYGLTREQILSNIESSYGELIIWKSCKVASDKNLPVHIIERGMEEITKENDPYYIALKKEFNFSQIEYDNTKSKALSNAGRSLTCKGELCTNNIMEIYLNSVLMKY